MKNSIAHMYICTQSRLPVYNKLTRILSYLYLFYCEPVFKGWFFLESGAGPPKVQTIALATHVARPETITPTDHEMKVHKILL